MAYELPPLPYDYAALEPFIDAETMKLHHDKHHQAYINNVNAALEKHPELATKSVDDLLRGLATVPEDIRGVVRNNGGGHSNHSMFWTIMGPANQQASVARPPALLPRRLPRTSAALSFHQDLQRNHCQAVRLRLGLAGVQRGQAQGDNHSQPGLAAFPGRTRSWQ